MVVHRDSVHDVPPVDCVESEEMGDWRHRWLHPSQSADGPVRVRTRRRGSTNFLLRFSVEWIRVDRRCGPESVWNLHEPRRNHVDS